ncbi:MAG: hypothetical protein NO483_02165 [Candidatus Methanomethylicia archaeon]|nr:hypothetical protein [Candidatus Methanomethylicia archaeon]
MLSIIIYVIYIFYIVKKINKFFVKLLGYRLLENINKIFNKDILAIIAVISMIFLLSGGIYTILNKPSAIGIYKSLTIQSFLELFASILLLTIGVIGLIFLEKSMRKTFDISSAKIRFLVGIALLTTSIILMEVLLWLKL